MKSSDFQTQISLGEDSSRQFKVDVKNIQALSSEMVAFANTNGGTIYVGVADDGSTPGLSPNDVVRVNQLISNAASQGVRSPLMVETENVPLSNGRLVVVLKVPRGIDKPYFDRSGVIWFKTGSDKRRVNSKEELRRLFQISSQFHADELPTKAGIEHLDKLRFRDFLRDVYDQEYPDDVTELIRLLQNMNLAMGNGKLNLAGTLMFTERPEWIIPQFVIKAIRYPGNEIHSTDYVDTEDFSGPLPKMFNNSLAFVMRNLHKIQAGRGVNAPGIPEIPESVFEELLVNALVHRDYLVSAPIRLFIFDNRIEIISPGHLPNSLTVEKIRTGNSNIRNPILISYVAKGLLPYHGLGSGIKRALNDWPEIEFIDDYEGCLFTVRVQRIPVEKLKLFANLNEASEETLKVSEEIAEASEETLKASEEIAEASEETLKVSEEIAEASEKTSGKIIKVIISKPQVTIAELAQVTGVSARSVERNIKALQDSKKLRRVGPKKGGYWEVLKL